MGRRRRRGGRGPVAADFVFNGTIISGDIVGHVVVEGGTEVLISGTAQEPTKIHDDMVAPVLLNLNYHPSMFGVIERTQLFNGKQGLGIFGGNWNWKIVVRDIATWGMSLTTEEHLDLHASSRVKIERWSAVHPTAPGTLIGYQGIKMGDGVVFSTSNQLIDCLLNGFVATPIVGAGCYNAYYERVTLKNCGGKGFNVGRGATLRDCMFTEGVNGECAAKFTGEGANSAFGCTFGHVIVDQNTILNVNGCVHASTHIENGGVIYVSANELAGLGIVTTSGSGHIVEVPA